MSNRDEVYSMIVETYLSNGSREKARRTIDWAGKGLSYDDEEWLYGWIDDLWNSRD